MNNTTDMTGGTALRMRAWQNAAFRRLDFAALTPTRLFAVPL